MKKTMPIRCPKLVAAVATLVVAGAALLLMLAIAPSAHAMEIKPDTKSVTTWAAGETMELSMDAFQPADTSKLARCTSMENAAPMCDLPYGWQEPETATHVKITTPDGTYESDEFVLNEDVGEITVSVDGTTILLDNHNVVVYADPSSPTVYPAAACDVVFMT